MHAHHAIPYFLFLFGRFTYNKLQHTNEKKNKIKKVEIKKMLDNGVVRKSESPWTTSVILVRKKDGTIKFCVDFRKLNEVTINN